MGSVSSTSGCLHHTSVDTTGLVYCQLRTGHIPAQSVHSVHLAQVRPHDGRRGRDR